MELFDAMELVDAMAVEFLDVIPCLPTRRCHCRGNHRRYSVVSLPWFCVGYFYGRDALGSCERGRVVFFVGRGAIAGVHGGVNVEVG